MKTILFVLFLVLGSNVFAGEILFEPRACVANFHGGGQPFPHLSDPGRIPWTKLDGLWQDTTDEGAALIQISSQNADNNQRHIEMQMIDAATKTTFAEGETTVSKDTKEIQIDLGGDGDLLVHAIFSVRAISDNKSHCAGKSVFHVAIASSKHGRRPGKARESVLGRIDQ